MTKEGNNCPDCIKAKSAYDRLDARMAQRGNFGIVPLPIRCEKHRLTTATDKPKNSNPHIIVGPNRRCLCGVYGIASTLGERAISCAELLSKLESLVQTRNTDAFELWEAISPLVEDCSQPTPPTPAGAGTETAVPTNYPWLERAHFLPTNSDTMLLAWVRGDHVTYRTGRFIGGKFIGTSRDEFRTQPNYYREVTGLFNLPDEGDKLRAELTAAREERDFCLAATDATEWIRINAMSGEEVKKELLEKGYTDERIEAGLSKIRAILESARTARASKKEGI